MTYYSSSVATGVDLRAYILSTFTSAGWTVSDPTITAPAGSGLAGFSFTLAAAGYSQGITVSGTGYTPTFSLNNNQFTYLVDSTHEVRISITSKNIFIWTQSTSASVTVKTIGMFGATGMRPYYASDNVDVRPIVTFGTGTSTAGTAATYSNPTVFMQNTPGVGQQWAPARLMYMTPTLEDVGTTRSINPVTAGGIVAFPYVVFSENTGVRGVLENMYFLREFPGGTDSWSTYAPTPGTTTYTIAGNIYRVHMPGRGTTSSDYTCFGKAQSLGYGAGNLSDISILVRE
jgi:hypothetical protein